MTGQDPDLSRKKVQIKLEWFPLEWVFNWSFGKRFSDFLEKYCLSLLFFLESRKHSRILGFQNSSENNSKWTWKFVLTWSTLESHFYWLRWTKIYIIIHNAWSLKGSYSYTFHFFSILILVYFYLWILNILFSFCSVFNQFLLSFCSAFAQFLLSFCSVFAQF